MTTAVVSAGTAPRRLVPTREWVHRLFSIAVVVGIAAVTWVTLAPVAVGGPTSYVITNGTSMLPTFRDNGLVVTRRAASYHVGEVVAYHNLQLHTVVMHRIVALDGDRFVFKGDNNPNTDGFEPDKAQIVGREWVYIPGGGRYFSLLREPIFFAIIMAMLGAYAAAAAVPAPRSRRRRHHGGRRPR